MADGLMKKLVKDAKKDVQVYSCGIFAEDGEGSTYNAQEAIKEYGLCPLRRKSFTKNIVKKVSLKS